MMRYKLLKAFAVVVMTLTVQGVMGQSTSQLLTGADQMPLLVSKLKGKKVGLMVNQTAMVGRSHLVDSLKSLGIDIKKIFSPEHGFRGTADAGENLNDSIDPKTGIPIISLYGSSKIPGENKKKPTIEQFAGIDIVVFDIQDVGVRFYTYIGSLHYLMESCAEQNKKIYVLDRPNPNGSLVDGPVLKDKALKGFVGMHPIPIAHGMSIGEYAFMINGEGWLDGGKKCDLEIISMKNWKHTDPYSLPVRPSPNLPNDQSIALYPSTCLFEGTILSEGRGTYHPFEWIGHPDLKTYSFQFKPVGIDGMSKEPKLKGQLCYGLDLSKVKVKKSVDLSYIIDLYQAFPDKTKFFNNYFNKLAGNTELKEQIVKGMSEEQIRATWQKDLNAFKAVRKKYLLYP